MMLTNQSDNTVVFLYPTPKGLSEFVLLLYIKFG